MHPCTHARMYSVLVSGRAKARKWAQRAIDGDCSDSIGSRLLGRGSRPEELSIRWIPRYILFHMVMLMSLDRFIFPRTLGRAHAIPIGFRFVVAISTASCCTSIWLCMRVSVLQKLLIRPIAWYFVTARVLKVCLDVFHQQDLEVWQRIGNFSVSFAEFTFMILLPLADALPHRLAIFFGRAACPVVALFGLYEYYQIKSDLKKCMEEQLGTHIYALEVTDENGVNHEVFSSVSFYLKCLLVSALLAKKLAFHAWWRPSKALVVREAVNWEVYHRSQHRAAAQQCALSVLLGRHRAHKLEQTMRQWQFWVVGTTAALLALGAVTDTFHHDLGEAPHTYTQLASAISIVTLVLASWGLARHGVIR